MTDYRTMGSDHGAELAQFALDQLREDPDFASQVAVLVADRMAAMAGELRRAGVTKEQIEEWAEAATAAYSERLDGMIALLRGQTKGRA